MGSELVSNSLPEKEEGEGKQSRISSLFAYTEKFYECFPYYLSIGMTYDQYWNGDPSLVKYYRKAEEIREDKKNHELWLQGLYIYEALCDASPIFRSLAKKGTKPNPYSEKPYALTKAQQLREKEEAEKKKAEKGKAYMQAWMAATKKQFAGKTQKQGGDKK